MSWTRGPQVRGAKYLGGKNPEETERKKIKNRRAASPIVYETSSVQLEINAL